MPVIRPKEIPDQVGCLRIPIEFPKSPLLRTLAAFADRLFWDLTAIDEFDCS
ncbi:MAG TPA: hypothetical protein IGS17_11715 [Oscillatoriales cyanobacterium M59_W2019_021]|nr:hypothetical protein [Oscillatoriales cyanobacterium M4454_W2019_049]HIK51572.1 hypothetical protein [Oscillatoriales cyanobacterium M59_W2019_021]